MKKQPVGGQAVIEGVMMQSKNKRAIAVRKNDGEIIIRKRNIKSWISDKNIDKIPFLRGAFILIETMIEGINSMNFSSEFFLDDEEEESGFDKLINKLFKDKANDVIIIISLIIGLFFAMLLFVVTPTMIGGLFSRFINSDLILNLIEGFTRICILFIYILLISMNKDIKRVFEYHGAEHKAIYCYENDLDLTVENARKFKTQHQDVELIFYL